MTYLRLVTVTLLITYFLIVVGAATRVFDAGMSCPDWPHCYGFYIPFPESKIPGGYLVAGQHYVWWQVLLEWGHRSLAASVGILMLALAALGYTRPLHQKVPLAAALFLLISQISLGALTIFQANSPASVAAHLGNAMLFFGALVWLRRAVAAGPARKPLKAPRPVRLLAVLFALAVFATMLIGAHVSSSHAGGVCGGLFSCGGQWLPEDLGQLMHMKHRYMAVVIIALSIALLAVAKRKAPQLRGPALHIHLMVWGQVALGVLTLYSFASYPGGYFALSVAHLAWGTLVWMAALGLLLTLAYGSAGSFHRKR